MRILQVNAVYKTKSTGRICMEIHKYFQSKGIESYVAYATENTDKSRDPNVFRVGNVFDHKLHAIEYRIDKLQGCHSRIATKILLRKISSLKPDIILTHNLHSNYLHVGLFFKGLKDLHIPVVVDLHDCWFLTGGCYHYTERDCNKWLSGCKGCELLGKAAEKKYKLNCEIFDYVKPTIVATSKWIEQEARKSLLSTRTDIKMIYDWIDTVTFYPRVSNKIRENLGIGNKIMILGVATGWSPIKGQKEMIAIAKAMPNAAVVLVGKQIEKVIYPPNVITIDFTDSKEELAELYSAADVFFNPSKQETFGLVSGEALACGTPIVVFNNTACPEFVTKYTGVVIEKGGDIVEAVKEVLMKNEKYGRDFIKEKCVKFVEDNFNMQKNIDKYIQLFNEIIFNNNGNGVK